MSHVSELDFEKTPHKHATMNFDDFDFLSPKYTLVSFLSIGNAYFSFRKTEPINRTSSCRILWGFPQRMADLFGTTGKPWTLSFGFL